MAAAPRLVCTRPYISSFSSRNPLLCQKSVRCYSQSISCLPRLRSSPTLAHHAPGIRHLSIWPFASQSPAVVRDAAPSALEDPVAAQAPVETAITDPTTPETNLNTTTLAESTSADLATPIPDSALTTDSWTTFQELGLGKTWFSGTFQKLFFQMHEITALPWWATIGITVISIRLILFPFAAKFLGQANKMAQLQPQFAAIIEKYQAAKKNGNPTETAMVQREMMEMKQRTGFNPLVALKLPLMQAPIFLGVFFGLKGMAEAGLPGFYNGGLAWFTNLAVPDPTWALPVMSVAATLAVIQVGADTGVSAKQQSQTQMLNIMRGALIFSTYFIAQLPAGVLVYWVTQNCVSLLQALVLKLSFIKRAFNIPERPVPSKTAPTYTSVVNPGQNMSFAESIKVGRDLGATPPSMVDGLVESVRKTQSDPMIKATPMASSTQAASTSTQANQTAAQPIVKSPYAPNKKQTKNASLKGTPRVEVSTPETTVRAPMTATEAHRQQTPNAAAVSRWKQRLQREQEAKSKKPKGKK